MKKMVYRLIAKERTFCEGSFAECKEALTDISNMIHAGLSTTYQLTEFTITSTENTMRYLSRDELYNTL